MRRELMPSTMNDHSTNSAQKLLLLAAIGYLHCIRSGAIHPDEVYRTLGQPRILDALAAAGAAPDLVNLVNGLDEPAWCKERMGLDWFERTIADLIGQCEVLLRRLGPPDRTEPPALGLFTQQQ